MNTKFFFTALLLISFVASAFASEPVFMPMGSDQIGGIVDLALIYQGGTHRIDWTKEQFKPYLTWTDPATQKEEWLFDGFLFLEFKSNTGHMYAKGYKAKPSNKEEQLWYLDRIFEKNKAVYALDEMLGETIARLRKQPPIPRRVVLTLPEPIIGTENWGELDGQEINFDRVEDRIAAVKWFTDQLTAKWDEASFKNIELAGFYWVAEEMGDSDQALMKAIGEDIRSRGKRFYWIPWWSSPGSKVWQELGFDVAYQQPNYFFNLTVPDDRVEIACDFGKNHGMGMEMEWDERIISDTDNFARRMTGYLDGFEKAGVWETAAVAHYMSGHGMIALSQNTKPEVRALYERLCRILAARQLKNFNSSTNLEK